jgi:hypothetical protein
VKERQLIQKSMPRGGIPPMGAGTKLSKLCSKMIFDDPSDPFANLISNGQQRRNELVRAGRLVSCLCIDKSPHLTTFLKIFSISSQRCALRKAAIDTRITSGTRHIPEHDGEVLEWDTVQP